MSDFHGGFYVERVDRTIVEPIRRVVRDYLFRETRGANKHELAFTTRRGAPVLHVAVRGQDADGSGYAAFHARHARLGGEIAGAARAVVHAYHYENRSGSEGVTTFNPEGVCIASAEEDWDAFSERTGTSGILLLASLPLGRLASQLGVDRSLLDQLIPYETPSMRIRLVGDVDVFAFDSYLRSVPSISPERTLPDASDVAAKTIYMPSTWLAELERVSQTTELSISVLLHLAWEVTKSELHDLEPAPPLPAPPPFESTANDVPRPPTPPAALPHGFVLPATAPPLPELPPAGDKVGVSVVLPGSVWLEVTNLTRYLDRSQSWVFQRAYRLARARLHRARRT